MITVYIDGVGLFGPGLEGWSAGKNILQGAQAYTHRPLPKIMPNFLPAIERRRASTSIRLAVQVAQEALEHSSLDAKELATVFVSADSDTEIINNLCANLATKEKIISPIRFHNSVHNAPAGYWHIAATSMASSTSLGAYDYSYTVGLLDAASQVQTEGRPILLCAYDIAVPAPLDAARPILESFATAFVLNTGKTQHAVARLTLSLVRKSESELSTVSDSKLQSLVAKNAIARALPLLQAIARNQGNVVLEYTGSQNLP